MADSRLRVLVTGATGFVGGHVTRHLCMRNWDVHVIARPTSSRDEIERLPSATAHGYDGSLASMMKIVDQAKPDVALHIASKFVAEHSTSDVDPLIESNLRFGTHLLEAMRAAGVTRFVNTGTAWQHYENAGYSPVNLYAATKQAFEAVVQYYVEVAGFSAITLELIDTYGPEDRRGKLLSQLKRASAEARPLLLSKGEQIVDFVHIDDVSRAYAVAISRLLTLPMASHEIFSVSSGRAITLKEFLLLVQQYALPDLQITWGARPYRPREMFHATTLPTLPGWAPEVDLREGIGSHFRARC